jgi:hypothetical protein
MERSEERAGRDQVGLWPCGALPHEGGSAVGRESRMWHLRYLLQLDLGPGLKIDGICRNSVGWWPVFKKSALF